jgi:hypothetical protein
MKKQATKTTKNTKKAAAPVVIVPAPVAAPEPIVVTAPVVAEPVSKRVTVGAEVKEYRIVASQRKGLVGVFLQGGHYAGVAANGRNSFVVGVELFYADRKEAAAALAERRSQAA